MVVVVIVVKVVPILVIVEEGWIVMIVVEVLSESVHPQSITGSILSSLGGMAEMTASTFGDAETIKEAARSRRTTVCILVKKRFCR